MANSALPVATVLPAETGGTAIVARAPPGPSKDELKAILARSPEMVKWTDARMLKIMEYLVKDDADAFLGFEDATTWSAWRAEVGKQAGGGNRALYKGIWKHWCKADPSICIDLNNPRLHL